MDVFFYKKYLTSWHEARLKINYCGIREQINYRGPSSNTILNHKT